jgi:hypothetical protein
MEGMPPIRAKLSYTATVVGATIATYFDFGLLFSCKTLYLQHYLHAKYQCQILFMDAYFIPSTHRVFVDG